MHTRERVTLSLVAGSLAIILPALVWAYVVRASVRDPHAFHDQGGMFVAFILSPLALVVWAACAVPAIVLAVTGLSGPAGRGGRTAWRYVATGLCAVGLLLALGTCVGPQVLAEALR
jgi:hypothetical protein